MDSTLLRLDFFFSYFSAYSIWIASNLLWYSFFYEFLMAFFSILTTSSSFLSSRPMYLKNLPKVSISVEICLICYWKQFSYLLVSLHRLDSYSPRSWSLLFLRSHISVMNNLLKQKMWKLVICDLNTIWVLSLSACSSKDSFRSCGTDFRIQKTCLSSCSQKQLQAMSLNLKVSIAETKARRQPRFGQLFLVLDSQSPMNFLIVATIFSFSAGNFFRLQRNIEWIWVRIRMMRMEGCFFQSMIWQARVMNSLGKTSRMNSGLKFFVELVMIMERLFFRKWKNLYSLSSEPKQTGSQWEIFSFIEVRFMDSFRKALIEMQSKNVSPYLISPVLGIFEMLRPRPSWFCRKVSLVWKHTSSFRIRSFSSSSI